MLLWVYNAMRWLEGTYILLYLVLDLLLELILLVLLAELLALEVVPVVLDLILVVLHVVAVHFVLLSQLLLEAGESTLEYRLFGRVTVLDDAVVVLRLHV